MTALNHMTKHHPYPEPVKPRKASRLPQMNKANKRLRRFYSGRTIPFTPIARPVYATPTED